MRRKVMFSIIIPVYNCDKYLPRCIDSILVQKYQDYEIILINDGSTDNSKTVCDEYIKKDKRVKVIHKNNEGVSKARNDGLSVAKGKYICFLDADDYLSGNYFKEVEKIFNKYENLELINFGFFSDVDDLEFNKLSSDTINYKNKLYKSHNAIKKDFINLWDNTMLYNIWNKVYVKKVLDDNNISFPDYNWGEDVAFNKVYLDSINTMYNSNQCFYHYVREREGAATKKYKSEIFEIRKQEFNEFNEYFEQWKISKDEYLEFSCRRYIERVLGCIENVYCSDMKFNARYKEIKRMIKDPITRETLLYAKPKSKKIKIMLLPIKLKLTLLTMLMGRMFNLVKTKFPSLFNKLKNRR